MKNLYKHILIDIKNCNGADLDSKTEIDNFLQKLINKFNFTPLSALHKKFEPQGVSLIYQLQESHVSIHTWPEDKRVSFDLFAAMPEDSSFSRQVISYVTNHFKGDVAVCRVIKRR